MYSFSQVSLKNLSECHPDLQRIAHEAIKCVDFKVIEGRRTKSRQTLLYATGKSKVEWPDSKHNTTPDQPQSLAFDFHPVPLNWEDIPQFSYVAGVLRGVAGMMGIPFRWGADWDRDGQIADERFRDYGHVELDY